jgi:hypothetical protein
VAGALVVALLDMFLMELRNIKRKADKDGEISGS